MKYLVVVVALAGCDKLFGVDPVTPGDSQSDAGVTSDGVVDSALDAPPCVKTGHDEDLDGADDACDLCPTFVPAGDGVQGDADADGLPDECDRDDSSTGDQILAYWTFPSNGFTGLSTMGGFSYDDANSLWNMNASAQMTTTTGYPLRRVDFHVSGVAVPTSSSVVTLRIGANVVCTLTGGAAGVSIQVGTTTGIYAKSGSTVRRVGLSNDGTRTYCELSDGGAPIRSSEPGVLMPGTVGIATNSMSSIKLEAIVIYGAK